MSSNNYPALKRIALIRDYGLNRFRNKDQFIAYLEDKEILISKRTLNRDFDFLKEIGYAIEYNSHRKKFKIQDLKSEKDNLLDRATEIEYLEGFKQNFKQFYHTYVIDEESRAEGIALLKDIFRSIDERLSLTFVYKKFGKNSLGDNRHIAPLQMKVSQNRWYVIGYDFKKDSLRVFGLDRIHELALGSPFIYENIPNHVVEELKLQNYYLGITNPIIPEPKKMIITLGVSDFLIEYWKVKPIHFTQYITGEKRHGLNIVELILVPNIDLVKLIVSSLGEVKLIEPESLKKTIEDNFTYGV